MEVGARDAETVIRGPRPQALAALGVATATFLVFASTLGHGFVNWDDDVYVTANPLLRSGGLTHAIASSFSGFYYYAYIPVTLLSHAADVELWGLNPYGHHLTNVLLHCANAAWVFLLALFFLGQTWGGIAQARGGAGQILGGALAGALFASLLFALHPLRAESVSWISDRKDLLCAFFLLPAVLAYLRYAARRGKDGGGWYAASFVLFVLAVLSKSIAIALPVVLLFLDGLWIRPRPRIAKVLIEKIPFLLVSLIVAALSLAQSPDAKRAVSIESLQGLETLLFPFHALTFSLQKTLFPSGLAPIYPTVGMGTMLAGLAAILLLTAAAALYAKRGRTGPLLAWLCYLVLLVPNVAGLSSGMQPVADRYAYVSTIGLYVLAGAGIARVWERNGTTQRIALALGSLAVLAVLASLTRAQSARWRSSTALWESVVRSSPATRDYVGAYRNLGAAYAEGGRFLEARETMERALAIDPNDAEVLYNLGVLAYTEENRPKALEFFRHATRADPRHARAFYSLAVVADQLGMGEEALEAMRRAARLGHPDAQEALRSRGITW